MRKKQSSKLTEMNEALRERAAGSGVVQICLILVAFYSVPSTERSTFEYVLGPLLVLLNALRILMAVFVPIQPHGRAWRWVYSVLTFATGIAWSALTIEAIITRSMTDPEAVLRILINAGTIAAAVSSLAADRVAAKAFIAALAIPIIIAIAFFTPNPQYSFCLIFFTYFCFLWSQINIHFRSLAAARSREEKFRALSDSSMESIVIHQQGLVKDINRACISTMGYSAEELIGKPFLPIIHPEDLQLVLENLAMPEHVPVRFRMRRKDGSWISVEALGHNFEYQGELMRVSCFRDITDRLAAEASLQESSRQIEAAALAKERAALETAQLKADFLANMSHEIRTPLSAIVGATDLLLDTARDEKQTQYFRVLKNSGEVLLSLINDILDFSKIEAQKVELEHVASGLVSSIEGHVELLASRAKQKRLSLLTEFGPDLPPVLRGDWGRIGQVMLNLVGNAIKFTETGGIRVRVKRASAINTGGLVRLRFEVEDTGSGIAPANLEKLFTPFTQADSSTSRRHGGTGLGLSISKKLVQLMGGEIGVHSAIGKGSVFWFELPFEVIQMEIPAPVSAQHVPTGIANEEPQFRGRILLAEDNSTNQMIASAYLRKLGLNPHVVSNGAEVLDALDRGQFDLILMDCQMPEMDGFEATKRIRALEKDSGGHIPIVALTANALAEDRKHCLEAGMDDYLSKPIRKDQLAGAMAKFLKLLPKGEQGA